jgi:hypothetical protein
MYHFLICINSALTSKKLCGQLHDIALPESIGENVTIILDTSIHAFYMNKYL